MRGRRVGLRGVGAGGRQAQGRGRRAGGRGATGGKPAAGRRGARRARATWARGLATGCALGALGLFSIRFDSVLFLSRFLDIVREPGS